MDGPPIDQRDYVRRLLEAYRATPGTSGAVHRADRLLAARLHERGVPLEAVENAFVLAATRRMIRSAGAVPLGTIRSLAYFSPVIDRKSTRLNSSHLGISYAVFCLKKKKIK